jgi:hypothetical protein
MTATATNWRGIVAIDEEKLMGYVHQAIGDFGALVCAALINVGTSWACSRRWPDPVR